MESGSFDAIGAEAAAERGAIGIGSILVRLPLEVAPLMEAWLREHVPDRAERVLSLIRQCRDGRLNDPRFGQRMRGLGPVAEMTSTSADRGGFVIRSSSTSFQNG